MTVRAMLSEAQRDGLVSRNVAALVRPFADQREERQLTVLSPEQARLLLVAAEEDRDGPLWMLAITTGCRQGELAGLRWQDVDLERRQLEVRRTLQYQDGLGWLEQKPKTSRSRRTVALPEIAATALERHRTRQVEERMAAAKDWSQEFGDQALPETAEDTRPAEGALPRTQALGGFPVGSSGPLYALSG